MAVLQVFLYCALGIRLTYIKCVKECAHDFKCVKERAHNYTTSAAKELIGKSTTPWTRILSQSCQTWRNKVAARRRQPEEQLRTFLSVDFKAILQGVWEKLLPRKVKGGKGLRKTGIICFVQCWEAGSQISRCRFPCWCQWGRIRVESTRAWILWSQTLLML